MTYQFTDQQIAEIVALRNGQGSAVRADGASFNNTARPVSGVYDYILSLISIGNNSENGPSPGIAPGVWQWFRGARDINRGEGVFSAFIRAYTAEQRRIRLNQPPTKEDMDIASDSIGDRVIESIQKNGNKLIGLADIGNDDAGAIGKNIFADSERPIAGWSGNILFPLLGESSFLQENILKNGKDAYDFLAMIHSAQYALSEVIGGPILNLAGGFERLWNISFTSKKTVDFGKLASDLSESVDFFKKKYGENFLSSVFDFVNNPGLAFINSYVTNDIKLCSEGKVNDNLLANNRDNILFGGGGDDYIEASDASLISNIYLDSDLIDGGAGFDTISYKVADAIEVKFERRNSSERFIATVDKSWTFAEDLLFNVEKIVGSQKGDTFSGDIASIPEGLFIDGAAGFDKIDLSQSKYGFNVDLRNLSAQTIERNGGGGGPAQKLQLRNIEDVKGGKEKDKIYAAPGGGKTVVGVDPLVLDLNGNGIEVASFNEAKSPLFDIDGDGIREVTAWIRGGDGLLARDLNHDGKITSLTELFGKTSGDGFADLAALDDNADGVIDAADMAFDSLRVWVDADGDAITDAGELRTLDALGIASISLTTREPSASESVVNGNEITAIASYTKVDGTKRDIANVALVYLDGTSSFDSRDSDGDGRDEWPAPIRWPRYEVSASSVG